MRDKTSALDSLTAAEKGDLLDQLLVARRDLREQAEAYAVGRMSTEDQDVVADDVESALCGLDIEELTGRAGYRPGVGYVHPSEAADEILDEALQLFLDDLQRRTRLGLGRQPWNSPWVFFAACTAAGTAPPNPCWSTPRITRSSARQTY